MPAAEPPREPDTGSRPDDVAASLPERVARSTVWPLLLGGRPHPFRHPEALLGLEISPLEGTSRGLRVRGELDVLSILPLEKALADGDLPLPFVLDFSGVTFMDGVGVALLTRLAQMNGGRPAVILRNPSRSVMRVLTIAAPDGLPGLDVQLAETSPPPRG
jgi:anti-anti-sigma factor